MKLFEYLKSNDKIQYFKNRLKVLIKKKVKMFSSNCIAFDKTSMRAKFTENPINESILITVSNIVPYITLSNQEFDSNKQFYLICGPLILLMKELANAKNVW